MFSRLDGTELGLDFVPHFRRRLDGFHHHIEFAKPALPVAHRRLECRIERYQRFGVRALFVGERAENVLGGKRILVVVVRGHWKLLRHHDPIHSRISIRLRRNQVLIVLTGMSSFLAS